MKIFKFHFFYLVPTWICAVPQREKKVKTIFASDMLKINETSTLWSLDCSNVDSTCSPRKG